MPSSHSTLACPPSLHEVGSHRELSLALDSTLFFVQRFVPHRIPLCSYISTPKTVIDQNFLALAPAGSYQRHPHDASLPAEKAYIRSSN